MAIIRKATKLEGNDMAQNGAIVGVTVNRGRGATPQELTDKFMKKVIYVSATAPTPIRAQAINFANGVEKIMLNALKEAAYNDRVTVYNAIKDAGHPDLANLIMRM